MRHWVCIEHDVRLIGSEWLLLAGRGTSGLRGCKAKAVVRKLSSQRQLSTRCEHRAAQVCVCTKSDTH